MATPLPLNMAPYVSPLTLMTAPTGIDWETIPPGDDVTPAQNEAELWNMCGRATARCNEYCNQVLRATIDTEVLHGPDFRVTVGPGAGSSSASPYWGTYNNYNTRAILSRWPVLEVSGVQVCPNGIWPRQWTSLPAGYFEPENPPIGIYDSIAPSGDAGGGQAILIAPGYVNWQFGRNGYIIMVTYVNGWPHAEISVDCAAGDTQITVDDCTGWGISNYQQTATGASGVIKDSGQQESVHVTTTTATSGPGVMTLSNPLNYPHAAGTLVSTMPASIEQACIYFATAEALTRGATSTTIHSVGGVTQHSGQSSAELISEGELLIRGYKRTI